MNLFLAACLRVLSYSILIIFFLIMPVASTEPGNCGNNIYAAESVSADALETYDILHGIYIKWHQHLFGSRNFYKRKLTVYLNSIIGKEIMTGYDFVLVSPEGIFEKRVVCKLLQGRWLHISGKLDTVSVRRLIKDDTKRLKTWWRRGTLVAVRGRVKKFWIGRDPRGDAIYLELEKVELVNNAP